MKDGSVSSGSDCGWIDYIVFPSAAPAAASVTGTVTYANTANTPLAGLTIKLKNDGGTVIATTTTNAAGNYSFSPVAAGNYMLEATTTKPWGGVSAADVLLYRKHIANITLLTGIYLASGDVNASGGLSAADVLLVKKRIATIINSFTVGDWLFNNMPFTVGSNGVTQNFKGITYGDANGSYIPAAGKSAIVNHQGAITLETIAAAKGEVIIPVHVTGIPDLGSFQFTVQYDPARLTPVDISDWYQGIDAVTIGNPAPGLITFVWAADVSGIAMGDGVLCNLHFTSNSTDGSVLNFINAPTSREFTDFDGIAFEPDMINGAVKSITGTEANNLPGFSVYPNPNNGKFTLRFDSGNTTVNIRVTNVIGAVVFEETSVAIPASHSTVVDLGTLPEGMYLLNVEENGSVKTQKVFVVR